MAYFLRLRGVVCSILSVLSLQLLFMSLSSLISCCRLFFNPLVCISSCSSLLLPRVLLMSPLSDHSFQASFFCLLLLCLCTAPLFPLSPNSIIFYLMLSFSPTLLHRFWFCRISVFVASSSTVVPNYFHILVVPLLLPVLRWALLHLLRPYFLLGFCSHLALLLILWVCDKGYY